MIDQSYNCNLIIILLHFYSIIYATAVNNTRCSVDIEVHFFDNTSTSYNAGTLTVSGNTNEDIIAFCQAYCAANSLIFGSIDYYYLASSGLGFNTYFNQVPYIVCTWCTVCTYPPNGNQISMSGSGDISFD